MKEITPEQEGAVTNLKITVQQYRELRDFVEKHRDKVYEWACAVRQIKESGSYTNDCSTWDEWCQKFVGVTAAAIRKIIWTQHERAAKKLVQETTGEAFPAKERANTSKSQSERKPIEVSARVDTQAAPPEMHKPSEMPRTQQLSVSDKLEAIERDLDRLSHKQLEYDTMKLVCRVLFEVKEVRGMLQPGLPLEVESSKKRSKGTKEEVIQYCVLVKLTREDGEWFYEKNVGSGWKVNGRPINDWQATINAWKIQMIFPSQKGQHGSTRYSGNQFAAPSRNEGTFNRDPSKYRDVGKVG